MNWNEGDPLPLGVAFDDRGANFSVYVAAAKKVSLCLFSKEGVEAEAEYPLTRTGDLWHIYVSDCESMRYCYLVERENDRFYLALDPYAKILNTSFTWGLGGPETLKVPSRPEPFHSYTGILKRPAPFDWGGVCPLEIPINEFIIYEMHVRGFTQDPSSGVKHPGTFLGVIEKIPYLKELGINAVELLPCFEFNECEYDKTNPKTGAHLYNFWGYSTVNFFAPMRRYAVKDACLEFRQMVRALHDAGIKVLLDVVYNHTAEGGQAGPTHCFKALAPKAYYMFDSGGNYANYSGCGNSINANHPVTIALILDSLRYWVSEMHVDGFRFDLASQLTRAENGAPLQTPPLIEAISKDPLLAKTKLIAEPWDAAGLYQVGNFPYGTYWAEWNGQFRDCVRRYIKGDELERGTFATRICGSQDIYESRSPLHSINFVIAHDGFTLHDLVSYNEKHNEENGEYNHDGTNDNYSWNCGTEGFSDKEEVLLLRERQMRNYLLALIISQGVPMVFMGDEYGHTKGGNNNTWCLDDKKNWFLWDRCRENVGLHRFWKKMLTFRLQHPRFRGAHFLTDKHVHWCNSLGTTIEWKEDPSFIGLVLFARKNKKHDLYIAFHVGHTAKEIILPPCQSNTWHLLVDTAQPSPQDFLDTPLSWDPETPYKMAPYSALMFSAFL